MSHVDTVIQIPENEHLISIVFLYKLIDNSQ